MANFDKILKEVYVGVMEARLLWGGPEKWDNEAVVYGWPKPCFYCKKAAWGKVSRGHDVSYDPDYWYAHRECRALEVLAGGDNK